MFGLSLWMVGVGLWVASQAFAEAEPRYTYLEASYVDIELACRDQEHVDRFIRQYQQAKGTVDDCQGLEELDAIETAGRDLKREASV